MIVDGVEMDFDCYYQFDTEGLHTVEFVFDEEYKTELPSQGFNFVKQLVSITIPESITSIPYDAIPVYSLKEFKGTYASKDGKCLIMNDTLIKFASGCSDTEYVIPNGVTTIGEGAFRGASSLTSITIPNSVITIGNDAFYGCSNLTTVTIPDSVTSIGEGAFGGCGLVSVTIPDGVTLIDSNAFLRCYSLTSVYCKPTTPPALGNDVFSQNASGRKIYVPMESVEAYTSAQEWSYYADAIVGYNF
jgi:hypothetical protein